MGSRTHDGAASGVGSVRVSTEQPGAVTVAAVAAAGRAVWTWHGVDDELEQLLRTAADQHRRQR